MGSNQLSKIHTVMAAHYIVSSGFDSAKGYRQCALVAQSLKHTVGTSPNGVTTAVPDRVRDQLAPHFGCITAVPARHSQKCHQCLDSACRCTA